MARDAYGRKTDYEGKISLCSLGSVTMTRMSVDRSVGWLACHNSIKGLEVTLPCSCLKTCKLVSNVAYDYKYISLKEKKDIKLTNLINQITYKKNVSTEFLTCLIGYVIVFTAGACAMNGFNEAKVK